MISHRPLPHLQLSELDGYYKVNQGESTTDTLTIKNIGQESLHYDLEVKPAMNKGGFLIHSWITCDRSSGNVSSDSEQDVVITFDASQLRQGSYQAMIVVTSTDCRNRRRRIPVELKVKRTRTPMRPGFDNQFDGNPLSSKTAINLQSHPNPFNPSTKISFTLPPAGFATLKIYNITGQEVAALANNRFEAGKHSVYWNAQDMPSGLYFGVLRSNNI